MFDKTFKISFKDLVQIVTFSIAVGVFYNKINVLEDKVDVIYSFYVSEGLKRTEAPIPMPQTFASEAILNHQELRVKKKD